VAAIHGDDSNDMTKTMQERIRRVSDRPARFVINTNWQPQCIPGNSAFR